jgi:hypothetical protein
MSLREIRGIWLIIFLWLGFIGFKCWIGDGLGGIRILRLSCVCFRIFVRFFGGG